ncbi:multiheme c-type cytochrome [Geothrix edaphica]|uniref:SHOCT domain-containing protein n=1 Tax=Geothrix edaphica TaxID=2927976 RepID=A0ABQ5Q0G2_9BACT|nr:multiheme c-type cytochrome [Geothrix edaphica]GLH67814.1 hypothetical protein GETHED_21780 [Geothrix edaphica]
MRFSEALPRSLLRGLPPFIMACFAALAIPVVGAEDCLPCHRQKTPGAVRQWELSAHARVKVGCATCHGSDHARIEKGEARVDLKVCGACHKRALGEHQASRHGMALHTGWGCVRNLPGRNAKECQFCHEDGTGLPTSTVQCARFLKQSAAMGQVGCNACHQVEASCATCHSNHGTDLKIARDPNVCATCHMGPDHPQWEMWQTSRHGTLSTSAPSGTGPTCQTCHMPRGSHDVSAGLTLTSGGERLPDAPRTARRAEMVQICLACHSTAFAKRELERDDAVQQESMALVKEAEAIIGDLFDHGLLDPMPGERPPHPLRGRALVLDAQMLYEDTSHIERLFFKMKKYDFAKTIKGAFHQNPAYTHWYGNAELKMDLVDIKAEAQRLRERKRPPQAAAAPAAEGIEARLRALKAKLDRGGITPEAYRREKAAVLEGGGFQP